VIYGRLRRYDEVPLKNVLDFFNCEAGHNKSLSDLVNKKNLAYGLP